MIFDYGGVLYAEGADDFDAFAAAYGLAPGRLWAAFHDIPEYGPSRRGEVGLREYLDGVVRALSRNLGPDRARTLVDDFQRARADAAALVPEMAALLDRLRGRVRLGLLSNAGSGARRRLEEAGVAARFDDVVCSGDLGVMKPDPAVFRLAAARLDCEASECAFVDDQERHVLGARSVGMRAHWHHRTRMPDLLRFLLDVGALPRG